LPCIKTIFKYEPKLVISSFYKKPQPQAFSFAPIPPNNIQVKLYSNHKTTHFWGFNQAKNATKIIFKFHFNQILKIIKS